MRLLLSSQFLRPDRRPEILTPAAAPARAALVANALDELGDGRDGELRREVGTLEAFGYSCTELDLREHFAGPGGLCARLADVDLVWVLGGNTFVLGRAMAQSGFGDVLRPLLARPDFVYGGYSAGAVIAGPDLRGIEVMDDPAVVPERYAPDVEPRCLGLVPFRIVPHWNPDYPVTVGAGKAAAQLADAGLDHRCLRDGEALTVEVGKVST